MFPHHAFTFLLLHFPFHGHSEVAQLHTSTEIGGIGLPLGMAGGAVVVIIVILLIIIGAWWVCVHMCTFVCAGQWWYHIKCTQCLSLPQSMEEIHSHTSLHYSEIWRPYSWTSWASLRAREVCPTSFAASLWWCANEPPWSCPPIHQCVQPCSC